MSRFITQLEQAVEVELFERHGRVRDWKRLTEAGQRLREVAISLADFQRQARSDAPRGPPPELTLRANDGVWRWLVLPALARFDAQRECFRLRVEASSTPLEDVAAGRCDLAVGLLEGGTPRGVQSSPLREWGMAAFVPVRTKDSATPSSGGWAWVEVGGLPKPPLDALEAELAPEHIKRAGLVCETFAQAARLVAGGYFAAVLPAEARVELSGVAEPIAGVLSGSGQGQRLHLQVRSGAVTGRKAVEAAFRWLEATLKLPRGPVVGSAAR